jgi:DNA-binding MarR family transcriptional regulator
MNRDSDTLLGTNRQERCGWVTGRGKESSPPDREDLEQLMSADMRAVTAQSDRLGRYFARQNDVSGNDFHALLHVMVAETAGTPLTMAQLRQRMDVSPAAITYLVDRMIDAGHVRRESDPADRRKALLRYENSGMELAHKFFAPLGIHLRNALGELPDKDLVAAHRVFNAMIDAMSKFEVELVAQQPNSATRRAAAASNQQLDEELTKETERA